MSPRHANNTRRQVRVQSQRRQGAHRRWKAWPAHKGEHRMLFIAYLRVQRYSYLHQLLHMEDLVKDAQPGDHLTFHCESHDSDMS